MVVFYSRSKRFKQAEKFTQTRCVGGDIVLIRKIIKIDGKT